MRISGAEWQLLLQGKVLEKLLDNGLLIIEFEGSFTSIAPLRIRHLTIEEAGLRFPGGSGPNR